MRAGCRRIWLSHTCQYTVRKPLVLGCRGNPISRRLHTFAGDVQSLRGKTRNIGIIAHIDAGKTTTTERMLYYSGYTRRIGDVDDGSTVTDFLPAERARGITIQSAAITFHWPSLPEVDSAVSSSLGQQKEPPSPIAPSHTINLIDTPGHADFTFEVLRSLRILDGAVCILDGVAGVEAQTEKVWYQAANYKTPKLIYVNKLDRDGACFGKTVKEIASKLHAWPAVCQIPWFEGGNGRFIGVVDVVNLKALRWADGGDGKVIKALDLVELEAHEPNLVRETRKARTALVELLSEYDDVMVEKYLESDEDHMAIMPQDITASLRRCVLSDTTALVPVFAGASFRNIGVQPLLDAVVDLLPSPEECPDPEISMGETAGGLNDLVAGKLALTNVEKILKAKRGASFKKSGNLSVLKLETCALAFKVVNDPKRGVIVYVRVYHGAVHRNALLFNTNLQVTERVPRLLKMYASDAVEVDYISAGQIGVIVGLKYARTGDTLLSYIGANPKTSPPAPLNSLQLRPIEVPPPVFFTSVEPQSLNEEKSVTDALALLLREDPSLQLSVDEESGQTLLCGMGELHLEIARDRLVQDLKAKATMGKIEIGYRECILAPGGPETVLFDRLTAGRKGKAGCSAAVSPIPEGDMATEMAKENFVLRQGGNLVSISLLKQQDDADGSDTVTTALPAHLSDTVIHTALHNGALAALARGPQHSFALHSTHVSLTIDQSSQVFGAETTSAALSSAARLATQAALKSSAHQKPTSLMEPVMNVTISVDEESLGAVIHDLTSARGGHILSLDDPDVISTASDNNQMREDLPLIDLRRVYAPLDPFEVAADAGDELGMASNGNRARTITARVPLKEMVGYLKHLRSLTSGRGSFVMSVDRFERMGGLREQQVLREMRGM